MSRGVSGTTRRRGMSGRRLPIKLRIRISVSVSTQQGMVSTVEAHPVFAEEFGDPFDESEGKQGNGK